MMPIGEENSLSKTIPVVTYVLIALNFLVFFLELSGGEDFIMRWAFIPSRFLANPTGEFVTIFTSMFMHAGWAHILGNMLYLWIFGDNVEDNFGKIKFLIFYLLCGVAATFAQMAFNSASSLPNIGASGAIAGVLGAYILMFPGEKIKVAIGTTIMPIPALIVIGFWFVMQFMSGISSLASTTEAGGVAYLAHIGGFITGLVLTFVFRDRSTKNA